MFSDGEEEVDVVTSVDAENAEDNILEAQIEKSDEQISPSSGDPVAGGGGLESDGVI